MLQRSRHFLFVLILVLAAAATAAWAQDLIFQLDPARSSIEFTLDAVLHTVHGTFRLKGGAIRFDPATGAANGELVLDATSGNTGIKGRDKKMHREVLESQHYPVITFTAQSFRGNLLWDGTSQVHLKGILNLHGTDHQTTVTAPVQVRSGQATADVHFVVPYAQWGLKNPSTFFLRVSDKVEITVHAVGEVSRATITASQK